MKKKILRKKYKNQEQNEANNQKGINKTGLSELGKETEVHRHVPNRWWGCTPQ